MKRRIATATLACLALVGTACAAAGSGAAAAPTRIHDVQGSTRVSPIVGASVTVPGVVTAVRTFGSAQGFWFQDPEPDDDPSTSEGLFVFTGTTTPEVTAGDAVSVTGTVGEFRPGGDDSPNQSLTQLADPTVEVTSAGNPLPAAEVLTAGSVPANYTPEADGGSIESLPLQPGEFALDLYESREGMLLRVEDAPVVGPSDDFGGLWVTIEPQQNPTDRGGTLYSSYESQNGGRVKIESLVPLEERPFPDADVGDRLADVTQGPLDYSRFGGYVLQASTLGELVDGGLEREVASAASEDQLTVGTYNVENLSLLDEQATFDRIAAGIVENMGAPDVVGIEEIQDDTGPMNDGVVSSGQTLARFVEAIAAAGGPRYESRVIDPVDNADGGQPGGNIRVAFLFDPARVGFVDRPGGDATTAVQAVPSDDGVALSVSPGRVQPRDPAWAESRKPLAGEFTFRGRTVFVVANHFASKGGDQPLHGRFQPPDRVTENQRTEQARVVRGFTDQLSVIDAQAAVVVLGDINDFPFSPTLEILTGGGLQALVDTLPAQERYNYVFDGNSQTLDHVLVSRSLTAEYDVVRINAEFADQASDHDPQVARLRFGR